MLLSFVAILIGLAVLAWSADQFVDGAAATAHHLGVPSLIVGIVIVGIGTSAPEMVVSAIAALEGNSMLALGNALGSNITNTGLILGITALVAPIIVSSQIVKKQLPLLLVISLLAGYFLLDSVISQIEAAVLLAGFASLLGWSAFSAKRGKKDSLEIEYENDLSDPEMSLKQGIMWLAIGMILLVASSRLLVWGAVNIAAALGVSDLIIGLTIVAFGTSLPELAASVAAARKGEHDIAIGNVVGSNMFNILAVIGIAGAIQPITGISAEVLTRDWMAMMVLTVMLLILGIGLRGQGRINRAEGVVLLAVFAGYNYLLIQHVING